MKKKTLVKLILAAGCSMTVCCFSGNKGTTDLDKLALRNIEAVEYKISGLRLE